MKNRVFVTGMGVVSPLGYGLEQNWQCLVEQRANFEPYIIKKNRGNEIYYIGKVHYMDEDSKYYQMAESVLTEALRNHQQVGEKTALIIGSSLGNSEYIFQSIKDNYNDLALEQIFPEYLVLKLQENYLPESQFFVVNSACSSSSYALGKAYKMIKDGVIDTAYVLGIDNAVSDIGLASFAALGVLSTEPCMKPFDMRHSGFILSEGAGAVILESERIVKKYNKICFGEIMGYGTSCDAFHIVAPDPLGKGAEKAMKRALKDAGIEANRVDYVNCHGTGTKLNDESEYTAMKNVFEHEVLASSTKALTGHLLGACGIVETIFSCMALNKMLVPGTANLTLPIDKKNIKLIGDNQKKQIDIVMNNTFAFGGQNASLIIKKGDDFFENSKY